MPVPADIIVESNFASPFGELEEPARLALDRVLAEDEVEAPQRKRKRRRAHKGYTNNRRTRSVRGRGNR